MRPSVFFEARTALKTFACAGDDIVASTGAPFEEDELALLERLINTYRNRSVLVTGGASFIGSHLVDRLLDLGSEVVVVDDFSSGRREHLARLDEGNILELDLADRTRTLEELPEREFVFHLAAVHGGRGFIDTFPDQVLVNLAIDNNVYTAAARAGT